jgi:hypothetical protein
MTEMSRESEQKRTKSSKVQLYVWDCEVITAKVITADSFQITVEDLG